MRRAADPARKRRDSSEEARGEIFHRMQRRPGSRRAAAASTADLLEKQLAQLARALRDDPNATTYAALSAFASRNAKNETGARAALALGYYDLTRDKPDLALGWLRKAVGEKLLREYVLYWQAQASLALGQKEAALEQLQSIRRDFPDSAMTEQTVTSLAQTALAIGKGEDALAALDAYPNTERQSRRCFCCARRRMKKSRRRKGEKPCAAAADYLDVYYRFPLNDEAKAAGQKIPALQSSLGEVFPRRAAANADRARRGVLHRQALARCAARNSQACFRNCRARITSARTFASCSAKWNWEASSSS